MTEQPEDRTAKRVDRLVSNMLSGRHLKVEPSDAEEQRTIRRASRLAGSSASYPRMAPEFRKRLAAQLAQEQPRKLVSRRTALAAGLSVAGGLALGVAVDRLPGAGRGGSSGPQTPAPGLVTPASGTARWLDVGLALDDLAEGVPVRRSAGAIEVFVVRQGQGVRAVSALCTHQPCQLVWNSAGGSLDCPCHGARFDVEGRLMLNVYPYPLPRLPQALARVRNGRIEVLGTAPRSS